MGDKKILIAESSVEFSEPLCDILEMHYDVCVCHSGLSVKGLLEDFLPDVLVMDLALPGLDGIALLQRIQAMSHRPKILLTTRFFSPYIEHAISSFGVDMVLIKPCNISAVADRVFDLADSWELPAAAPVVPKTCVSSMLWKPVRWTLSASLSAPTRMSPLSTR
jgi:two-component system response regulator (stage 0 sporulation protein A)